MRGRSPPTSTAESSCGLRRRGIAMWKAMAKGSFDGNGLEGRAAGRVEMYPARDASLGELALQELAEPGVVGECAVEAHPVRRLQRRAEQVARPQHDVVLRGAVGKRHRVGQARMAGPQEHAGLGFVEQLEAERPEARAGGLVS